MKAFDSQAGDPGSNLHFMSAGSSTPKLGWQNLHMSGSGASGKAKTSGLRYPGSPLWPLRAMGPFTIF